MKDFKISSHSCSKIMTKLSSAELPQGAKTYCETWYIQEKYNRKKDFYSKYIDKGLAVEHLGIKMLSRLQGLDLHKNEEFFANDYIQGQPDVIENKIVFDIKSSWDIFSFPHFDKELPNDDYFWQLQCYMILTELREASVVYVLIDTPRPLIQQELKKLYYQSGGVAEDWTPETYAELEVNYRFDDVPDDRRIKVFSVPFDPTAEAKIRERVILCRNYINSINS